MPRRQHHTLSSICVAIAVLALAVTASACGSGSGKADDGSGVTIESLLTRAAPTGSASPPIGGKPADPGPGTPTQEPAAGTTTASDAAATPVADATPAVPPTLDGSVAPTTGKWIDVDVTRFTVRLMDGATVVREIGPVAVGEAIDTGDYASTQTGTFHVYNKVADLAYDPPYDTYISNWVGFDADRANGFHSFLEDSNGKVVDPRTGRISNGCIRTGAPDVIFAFAEPDMPVFVHH